MQEIPILKQARIQANRLLFFQFAVTVVASGLLGLWLGGRAAYSVFTGGLICVIGNGFLSRYYFSKTGASAAKGIVRSLYFGEMGKIILSAALFLVAMKCFYVHALPFFVGYIAAQAGFWAAPWFFNTKSFSRA